MTALGVAFDPSMLANGERRSHTTRPASNPRSSIAPLAGFDPDQLRGAMCGAEFEHAQLGAGLLNGHLVRSPLETGFLSAGCYSVSLAVRGTAASSRFSLIAVLESPAELLVNGHRPRTGDLIVFQQAADVQATFPAGFRWMHIAVRDTESAGLNRIEGLVSEGEHRVHVLRPHYRSALAIRRAAAAFLPPLSGNPQAGPEPLFPTEACHILAELVRGAVGSAIPVENGDLGIEHQRRMVDRCSEFMKMRLKKPASLAELCRVAFASPRALEYAFKAIYQASPMTYYRAQRFSAARRDLLHSDKKSTSVTDIAKRFGFWHFGRFSTDYRIRFMESPSDTLARHYEAQHPRWRHMEHRRSA